MLDVGCWMLADLGDDPGGFMVRFYGEVRVDAGRPGKKAAGTVADIEEFARARLGFQADEKQAAVLRGGRRGIVNCTRQWGKSTVAAVKAVHRAHTAAGSLTLVLSPSGRQSGEFLRKAEGFVQRLGIRVRGDGVNEL